METLYIALSHLPGPGRWLCGLILLTGSRYLREAAKFIMIPIL